MKLLKFTVLILISLIVTSFALMNEEHQVRIKIETSEGTMVAVLYNETPLHRDNFVKNIREGIYDSLLFHRVIYEFMIQGGDPDSRKADSAKILGEGTLGYTIPAEFIPAHFHRRGALAMARQGDDVNPEKASSSCQFYIVQGKVFSDKLLTMYEQRFNNNKRNEIFNQFLQMPENKIYMDSINVAVQRKDNQVIQNVYNQFSSQIETELNRVGPFKFSEEQRQVYTTIGGAPHLDGNYTVFGRVIEGLDVIDKIAAHEVDGYARPKKDVRMKITIIE